MIYSPSLPSEVTFTLCRLRCVSKRFASIQFATRSSSPSVFVTPLKRICQRGWGYYGYGSVGPVSTTTRVTEYEKGTLVVDIWDAKTKELVWRGAVTKTVPGNVDKAGKLIDKAVRKMADQGRKLWAKEKASRSK